MMLYPIHPDLPPVGKLGDDPFHDLNGCPPDWLVFSPALHSSAVRQYGECQRAFLFSERLGLVQPTLYEATAHLVEDGSVFVGHIIEGGLHQA